MDIFQYFLKSFHSTPTHQSPSWAFGNVLKLAKSTSHFIPNYALVLALPTMVLLRMNIRKPKCGKGGSCWPNGLCSFANELLRFQVVNQFPQSILPKLSSKTHAKNLSLQRMSEAVTPTFPVLTFPHPYFVDIFQVLGDSDEFLHIG